MSLEKYPSSNIFFAMQMIMTIETVNIQTIHQEAYIISQVYMGRPNCKKVLHLFQLTSSLTLTHY